MSPSEYIKHEADEITSRTGRYIPPYRMNNLMKAAQKVTDYLVRADVVMTYAECVLVLDIVRAAIRGVTGEEKC